MKVKEGAEMKLAETQVNGPIGNITINSTAIKHDAEKPRFDLVPPGPLLAIAQVFTHGAEKYGVRNYLKGEGLDAGRLLAAVMRHLNAYHQGRHIDPDSGLTHLAHAAAGLMMLEEIEERKEP